MKKSISGPESIQVAYQLTELAASAIRTAFVSKVMRDSQMTPIKLEDIQEGDHVALFDAKKQIFHHVYCSETNYNSAGPRILHFYGSDAATAFPDYEMAEDIFKLYDGAFLVSYLDQVLLKVEDMSERAFSVWRSRKNFIGKYDLSQCNCEHLITWIRTGVSFSLQIHSIEQMMQTTLNSLGLNVSAKELTKKLCEVLQRSN